MSSPERSTGPPWTADAPARVTFARRAYPRGATPLEEEALVTISYRFSAALATVALAAGAGVASADSGDSGDGGRSDVLRSSVFGSTPRPVGPVLFGVNPGGAPWVIGKGEARVRRGGRVEVRVRGLVIPTAPQNGTNPLSGIAATVYCGGTAVGTTRAVPFSPAGDARIEDRLSAKLPEPCLVPAVLLNPAPNGVVNTAAYIAATGE
jgi:hypothetical protein